MTCQQPTVCSKLCVAETTTVRETERKYSGEPIDADLAAALATVAAEATNGSAGPPREPVECALSAVYFDTEDLRLARSGITLRRGRRAAGTADPVPRRVQLGVPAGTVRSWLRRVARRAERLRGTATEHRYRLDPVQAPPEPTGSALGDALAALAAAVQMAGRRLAGAAQPGLGWALLEQLGLIHALARAG
jgi:hypothetical protein